MDRDYIYVKISRDTHNRVKEIAAEHGIAAQATYSMIASAFLTPKEARQRRMAGQRNIL